MAELSPLRAIGHFTLWFLIGHALFVILRAAAPGRRLVQLYGPLLPFVLATYAALPYLAQMIGWIDRQRALSPLANIFLFYPFTEQHSGVRKLLGNFHLNVLVLGLSYSHLVVHYIRLITRLERDIGLMIHLKRRRTNKNVCCNGNSEHHCVEPYPLD